MTVWWDALRLDLQIFYALGILATIVLFFQFVMMFFGLGDHDIASHDVGSHDGHGHSDGVGVISIRSVTAFFFGFGWSGALAIRQGFSTFASVLIAFAVGFVFMMIVYSLMRFIYGLRASGTVDYKNAIGQVGDVYVSIPSKESGSGQVQIMVQGRMRFVPAYTKSERDLTGGSKIRVVSLIDERTVLVEPLSDSKSS
jgi:hypothetical protein